MMMYRPWPEPSTWFRRTIQMQTPIVIPLASAVMAILQHRRPCVTSFDAA